MKFVLIALLASSRGRSSTRWLLALWLTCSACVASPSLAQDDAPAVRFALIVGANHGGKTRTELRYAQSDARLVTSVLEQLGGVDAADRLLLLEPSPEDLLLALQRLAERAQRLGQAGRRTELLFYYSGHSDELGLLLGERRFSYRELRDALSAVSASVHVGILDSCASGALTRLKGGARRAPFLLDRSNAVEGHAFLASSSADEGAQESDRLGASYFTHFLVSGLRGAADFSGDGRVTLNEAYRFAFDETLARTEDSRQGPQHASYDIALAGTGDLVITDLRQPAATLRLPRSLVGRVYVRNTQGQLVVELNKQPGRVVDLALEAEPYQVLLEHEGTLSRAQLVLPLDATIVIARDQFRLVQGENNRVRGTPRVEACRSIPFGFGIVPRVSTNARYRRSTQDRGPCIENRFALHIAWGEVDELRGFTMALGGTQVFQRMRGAQSSLGINLADQVSGLQLSVGANVADRVEGAQLAVGLNIARTDVEGLQLALVNVADVARGIQLALVNGALWIQGTQLGIFNGTRGFAGVQAGLFNVNGGVDARGLQLGLVNVTGGALRGAQLGLINYADRASAQVGLVGITRNGGVHPLVFSSDLLPVQAGVRFDADHTYSTLIAGLSPVDRDPLVFGLGGGIGAKWPIREALWFEPGVDVQVLAMSGSLGDDPSIATRLLLPARYAFHPHLSVFGGPVLQMLTHQNVRYHGDEPGFSHAFAEFEVTEKDVQVLTSLGFVVGASL